MTDYQKIEYRIGKDGTITETVLNAAGLSCTEATVAIEHALGTVESQEFLPAYYEDEENLAVNPLQSLQQNDAE